MNAIFLRSVAPGGAIITTRHLTPAAAVAEWRHRVTQGHHDFTHYRAAYSERPSKEFCTRRRRPVKVARS